MRIPDSLVHLLDEGIIDEVVRPLLAGKEAQIYWVTCDGESRVAKVYKAAEERSFHQRADYTEGRAVRNSRDQRAMRRGSRYGKAQNEKSWQTTEVDTIYRLKQAGVRVPEPHHFIDGVLIMELVSDAGGMPAPRLSEAKFSAEEAKAVYRQLLAEVVRMLCAGVIHGDLSDFNVLMDAHGPVVIDFPQAIDAARNANAKKILLRDVENLHRFMGRFIADFQAPPYGQEIWQRYEQGTLTPTTQLEGRYTQKAGATDTVAMMDLIREAQIDNAKLPSAAPRRRRGANTQGAAGPPSRVGQPGEPDDGPNETWADEEPQASKRPQGAGRGREAGGLLGHARPPGARPSRQPGHVHDQQQAQGPRQPREPGRTHEQQQSQSSRQPRGPGRPHGQGQPPRGRQPREADGTHRQAQQRGDGQPREAGRRHGQAQPQGGEWPPEAGRRHGQAQPQAGGQPRETGRARGQPGGAGQTHGQPPDGRPSTKHEQSPRDRRPPVPRASLDPGQAGESPPPQEQRRPQVGRQPWGGKGAAGQPLQPEREQAPRRPTQGEPAGDGLVEVSPGVRRRVLPRG